MSRTSALIGALAFFALTATSSAQERMTPELLWKLGRLGGATVSSDGSLVAYSVRHYELEDDKGSSTVHVRNLETGTTRTLVRDWASAGALQFGSTPFGERIFFSGLSGANEDDSPQVWALNPVDGALLQVTDVEDGVANLKVSPTGKHIAFTVDVKLDDTVNDLYEDLPEADARIIDSLMFRHWNAWHDFKYSHLHIAAIGDDGRAGEAVDLMEGMKIDCPVPPFGGSEQFNWSPDGTRIAYTAKDVERWAESTDSDVYLLHIDAPAERKNLTAGQLGYDNDPVFSPDGSKLAYHSMERPGFEADRNRIMIRDLTTGAQTEATAGLDRTAHGATWLPDASGLLFMSEHRGTNQLFRIAATGGDAQQVTEGVFNWGLVDVLPGGSHAIVNRMDMKRPKELAMLSLEDGTSRHLTDINGDIYAGLELPSVEERWVEATDGKQIHCWVIYPPDFDASKKWPLLTYCQGGPQGQIGQWFSYRWNFHLMAAAGYVVVAPNRRGLPGFGREWNDQISGDWGGQAMQDILSATDSMLAEPYIDPERTGAIGASFGGYTVYWLMGNHEDRFQTMISHCGVFNLESMYGSTEELFFVNWDLGGPYYKDGEVQKGYDRFSPHKFAGNWETPLLVIHGEKDFRVPVTQGMEAFNAAQVQGVPSRFLYYPKEGHWVQKPQNGVLWHRVFFDWLGRSCMPQEQTGP
jgi:dipeptidyl aminopeptidase/acylaminoacyl peptidase